MKPGSEAVSAKESVNEVAQGVASVDQLRELKIESKEQFDELKQQIEDVAVRVTRIESASKARVTTLQLPARTEEISESPRRAVTFGGEDSGEDEGILPKTLSRSPITIASPALKSSVKKAETGLSSQQWPSEQSSCRDDGDAGTTYGALGRGPSILMKRPRQVTGTSSLCTVWGQSIIASKLSLPIRLVGLTCGFITVILLWEFTDGMMKKLFPVKDVLLISYLGLSILAACLLALSHTWVRHSAAKGSGESSLMPSFAYALSTLFAAIGTWGSVVTAVSVLVPPHLELFCYGSGGAIALACTMGYAFQTRHNVLLDIASCATSLGLNAEGFDDDDSDVGASASQSPWA